MNTLDKPSTHNQPEYTVSELSSALRRTVEDSFGYVRVRGELSGVKRAASGHIYMDLKDDKAVLNAVCWKGSAGRLPVQLEDGLEIIATGKLTTYAGRSSYQLVIESVEPAGLGALMALLEKRKVQLTAEGLFAPERKRALPFMPQVIGVITSPTGAVIRDILHRIEERFPVHVLVWPVLVQGEGAANQITSAIEGFNNLPAHLPTPDLLIVARGGGSMEDLWCFNEENVVRAAAASRIPLISAVGHETDTTLIDFASDKRAPTPTAAAEMAVPVREEWMNSIEQSGQQLRQRMMQFLSQRKERVEGLARGILHPQQILGFATQRLDDWAERLCAALPALLQKRTEKCRELSVRLHPRMVQHHLSQHEVALERFAERLSPAIERHIERKTQSLLLQQKLFDSLHYQNVLKRGFVLARGASGAPITQAESAQNEAALTLQFSDGQISVSPQKKSTQGTLF